MKKIKFNVVAVPQDCGMLYVKIRCEQFGKYVDIDTNVHIFSDEWDNESGRVINNPNAKKLNILIRKTLYQLEEYELEYDGDFTLAKLKEVWDGREASHDFYSLMEYQINHRDIREGTRGIHRRVLVHLRRYKSECSVGDLTEDFVKGFIRYMKDVDLSPTTISMHIHALRCYYNIARKLFGSKVPYGTFDFYHEKLSDRLQYKMKSFTDEDIRLLENYIVKSDTPTKYKQTLEQFLFMAYTGVRISDFMSFTEKNFTMENGKMWLTYTSVKTDTPVRLPMWALFDGRAEQLYSKYKNRLTEFFNVGENCRFNARLKTALKKCNLKKHVTAHVARHTCASRLINRDIPITTIQQVIGHRQISMTMIYARINDNSFVRQLQKL